MLFRSTDCSNSIPFVDIRISQGTSLSSPSDLSPICTIDDKGTTHRIQFNDINTLQTFALIFEQAKQQCIQHLKQFCDLLANNMGMKVPDPFLDAVTPLLYCTESLDVNQQICNIHWFFVTLSPEYKRQYAPFLSNLIHYLTAQCKIIPDMVKSLTDLESTLSIPVEDMDPFSYADIQHYYSNWVLVISQYQGTVYQAVDNLTKEKVSVKVYKNSNSQLKSIKNEIFSMNALRDLPSIVHLVQVYCCHDTYYLVEELMQGMTLLDYVKEKGPLTERDARVVMRVLLETLSKCHERHILHRDIRLDNVMFRTSENKPEDVVLLDFGFSVFAPADLSQSYVGVEEYLSPDVLGHSPYSEKTDMWSLGVLFYGLVTGLFPFGSRNDAKLKANIQSGSFARGESFQRLSSKCQDFVSQLLQVNTAKRYSAEDAQRHPWMQSYEDDYSGGSDPNENEVIEDGSARVALKRSHRIVRPVDMYYRILRAAEVRMTPDDTTLLSTVSAPLEVRVTSVSTNWDTNEMWVQVQENIYYNNQPDRIEGKWILCQRGNHSPYAMNKQHMLFRGVNQMPLFVLPGPRLGGYILTYPTNHYVIIEKILKDEMRNKYGEISEQSMLVFTHPQEKEFILRHSLNYFLPLTQNGTATADRLI